MPHIGLKAVVLDVEGLSFCTPVRVILFYGQPQGERYRSHRLLFSDIDYDYGLTDVGANLQKIRFFQWSTLTCISNSILLQVMAQIILNHHQVGSLMTEPLARLVLKQSLTF